MAEIVTFMGFANLLISRLESAMQFASRLFLQLPGLEEYFGVLDAKTSVPEQPDAVELDVPKRRGRVRGGVLRLSRRPGHPVGRVVRGAAWQR